jgi:circadian clock protein KaiB
MKHKPPDATRAYEQALAGSAGVRKYVLRLYVTGMTPRSTEAINSIRSICDEHLPESCDLQVIDIYQNPAMAKECQIIAAPTLIKELPLPLRRLIGNLTNKQRVLAGLGLHAI